MATDNNPNKRKTVGRKPKSDPAVYRYGIKLNAEENGKFELLFLKSGLSQRAKFIKTMIFGREIKVVGEARQGGNGLLRPADQFLSSVLGCRQQL